VQRLTGFGIFAAALLAGTAPVCLCAETGHPGQKVAVEVASRLSSGADSVRVIVRLSAPPEASVRLDPASDLGERIRRAAIAPLVNGTINRLREQLDQRHVSDLRPFQLQPAFAAAVNRAGLDALTGDPRVRSIVPDRVFTAQTVEGLEMMGARELHQQGFSGEGTAIAVIDTGIDYFHPTLGGGAIPNPKVVRGLDTGDGDDDPMDCGAHGTAVASVAAGTSFQWNPQQRFAGGVAPQARIFAYKASPDSNCGAFAESSVIQAMEDAILHRDGDGYRLAAINLSFGSGLFAGPCDEYTPSLAATIEAATQAGIAVVASAGNQGRESAIASPACISDAVSVGSVWDQDSGFVAYSFCLDDDCRTTCNDSYRPAGAVSCYSNNGAVLDLLAPSEYLEAARAGGQLIQFGGTSGAAAYITGAFALMQHAAPDWEPGSLRRLLQITGMPTMDERSGRVRPRVQLGRSIDEFRIIGSSTDVGLGIPNTGAARLLSTLRVDEAGPIGSVRVLLHLAHPNPEQLTITLQSPDGPRVRLHDRTPGTVDGFDGPVPWYGGVWGLYPDELEPSDSLGAFSGLQMAGEWRLEIVDEVADGIGDEVGRLVGWSVAIQPLEPPTPDSGPFTTIPVAAHTMGENDSPWVSDVRVFNPSPSSASQGTLYFVHHASGETEHTRQTRLTVPHGSILDLQDVVARRFDLTNHRGSLHLQSDDHDLVMTSRTFTTDAHGGNYGQYIGASDPDGAVAVGEGYQVVMHLADSEMYRTNLGITELTGLPVTVRVKILDGITGQPVGPERLYAVDGFENRQVRLELEDGGPFYALLDAVAGGGRATTYVSVVDNATSDAVFVPGIRPAPDDSIMVPVVAKIRGQAGTDWKTELVIANLSDDELAVLVEYRPRRQQPGSPAVANLTLGPGMLWKSDDAVTDLFSLDRAAGSLRIVVPDGPARIAASARVFNQTAGGSYGQFVPGVAEGVGLRATSIHVDEDASNRTNLGVCEVGGNAVQIRCEVIDSIGRTAGEPIHLNLDPFELVQINGVFEAVAADDSANARVECVSESGHQSWIAFASVVDGVTGDAIYVPAQSITR
jgi:subtilisin-like proprotein convertase family protein